MSRVIEIVLFVAIATASVSAISPYQISNNYEYGPTKIQNYPHHASLRTAVDAKHYCSGAIISERWLLTSAQCTQGANAEPANIFVVVGVTNVSDGGDRYELAKIVNHPAFEMARRRRVNDIAMLKTTQNIRMKLTGVLPISLPSFKGHYVMENGIGTYPGAVTGWEDFAATKNPQPGTGIAPVLHMQRSNVRERRSCRRHLGHINGLMLTEDHLCTVFDEQQCVGDTGSPLVSDDKEIIGIASWHAFTKCGYGYPKVYTYVYSYLQWINTIMYTM